MVEQEATWHVTIDDKEQGPLTTADVHEFIRNGMLSGSDLIWRPGFPEWKSVSDVGDFWRPPLRTPITTPAHPRTLFQSPREIAQEPDRNEAPSGAQKWSLWRSANIGLLASAVTLLLQIGNGRGFELANYAHTASGATISGLVGQILAAPLIFVLIAVVRNLMNKHQRKSSLNAFWGMLTFVALFALILGGLLFYGEVFFTSSEIIAGETRKNFIVTMSQSCIQQQHSRGQNVTELEIEKYCTCTGEKVADFTTYKQLGTAPDAGALAELKQKVGVAGASCQVRH